MSLRTRWILVVGVVILAGTGRTLGQHLAFGVPYDDALRDTWTSGAWIAAGAGVGWMVGLLISKRRRPPNASS